MSVFKFAKVVKGFDDPIFYLENNVSFLLYNYVNIYSHITAKILKEILKCWEQKSVNLLL